MMPAVSLLLAFASSVPAVPWWDDYPTTVQTSDAESALAVGADSCLCGVADDPCWGIHATRCRYFGQGPRVALLRERGVKLLTWTETFGTCEEYIADFQVGPDRTLLGHDADPSTPRPVINHWGWQIRQPLEGRVTHWLGLGSYYEDELWVRPWTRTHPRYGAPPFRYPDGTIASGYLDGPGGRPLHRLYDAGCSKDVLGELGIDYGDNGALNEVDPTTGRVRGPVEGLVPHETPEGMRYAGLLSFAKDSACPHWIQYARASSRQLVDFGVEGLWADNFSAWDSFGNPPLRTAFGEWSVSRFREHLRDRLSAQALRELGITDLGTFDVRHHLRRVVRDRLGGDDTNLSDPRWRDAAWLDDPIWREYMVFKVATGRQALQQFHDTYHEVAREAGIVDFAIQGNDIPIWSFGMPRPESLEMVSTEFSPGWNLLAGPRGVGLPPRGRLAPIVKTARAHQAGRFVHLWYYLDAPYKHLRGNKALGRALSYELLANHAMIQAYPSAEQVAGTVETHAEVTRFIHESKGLWADRRPLAQIGLVYSPASRLAELTPGGMLQFDGQRHAFDLLGWGTALSELHLQYTVVPEWELNEAALQPLGTLILPSTLAVSPETVESALRPWVARGGTLILSGPVGERKGLERSLERAANEAAMLPELCVPAGLSPDAARPAEHVNRVGKGSVVAMPAHGFAYYQTPPGERRLGQWPPAVRDLLVPHGLLESDAPRELEVSVFASPTRPLVFIDVANLDLNPDTDEGPRPHTVTLRLALPGRKVSDPKVTVSRPRAEPATLDARIEAGRIVLGPLTVGDYVSVAVEGWQARP